MTASSLKDHALDIIFPPHCISCGTEGKYVCEDCFYLAEIFEDLYCPFCAAPKIVPDGKTCQNCRKSKKLTGLFCAASYDNQLIRDLIHKFKYEPLLARCLAVSLADFIIQHIQRINKNGIPQCLWIPIPLHKKRFKKRGFNQAEELAKILAVRLGGRISCDALIKIRQTESQADLEREARNDNISSAFACAKPEEIKNQTIFLVDDVFTTGATLEECARVLKSVGAKEVWGVVVARG